MDGEGAVTLGSHGQGLEQPPSYSEVVEDSQPATVQPQQPPDENEGIQSRQILAPLASAAPPCFDPDMETQQTAENTCQQSTQPGEHPGHRMQMLQPVVQPVVVVNSPQIVAGTTTHLPYSVNSCAML